jgi:hypothetical protein
MLVAGDEPDAVVEHAQALCHVAERSVEMTIALAQLMLLRKQDFVLPLQLGDRFRRFQKARDGSFDSAADHFQRFPTVAQHRELHLSLGKYEAVGLEVMGE